MRSRSVRFQTRIGTHQQLVELVFGSRLMTERHAQDAADKEFPPIVEQPWAPYSRQPGSYTATASKLPSFPGQFRFLHRAPKDHRESIPVQEL